MNNAEFKTIIMGVEYTVKLCTPKEQPKFATLSANGLCEPYEKALYINIEDAEDKDVFEKINLYYLQVLRHEMVHAMFFECGLTDYMRDETLVEALACIYPKATNDFARAGIELTKLMVFDNDLQEQGQTNS